MKSAIKMHFCVKKMIFAVTLLGPKLACKVRKVYIPYTYYDQKRDRENVVWDAEEDMEIWNAKL